MWVECSEIIGRCLIGKHNLPRCPPHTLPKCNLPSFAPSCTFPVPKIDFLAEFILHCCHSNPIEKEAIIANPPFSCQFPPAAQKGNFRHILPRNICEKDNFPIICASAVVSAPAADNAAIMCCWLFPEVHYPSARIRQLCQNLGQPQSRPRVPHIEAILRNSPRHMRRNNTGAAACHRAAFMNHMNGSICALRCG